MDRHVGYGEGPRWVSAADAAEAAGVSPAAVRGWADAGYIVSQRSQGLAGEQVLVRLDEVLRHVGRPVDPPPAPPAPETPQLTVDAVPTSSDLAPILKAVPELMTQLTAATDRAARAETKLEFLTEQITTLREQLAQAHAVAPTEIPPPPPPPVAQVQEAPEVPEPQPVPEAPQSRVEVAPAPEPVVEVEVEERPSQSEQPQQRPAPTPEPTPEFMRMPEPEPLHEPEPAPIPTPEPVPQLDPDPEPPAPEPQPDPTVASRPESTPQIDPDPAPEDRTETAPWDDEQDRDVSPEDLFASFLNRISESEAVRSAGVGPRPEESFREGFLKAVAPVTEGRSESETPEQAAEALWGTEDGPEDRRVKLPPYEPGDRAEKPKRRWWSRKS